MVATAQPLMNVVSLESGSEFGGFEPFVDEQVVGRFLGLEPRRVVEMARNHQLPAHPIGRVRRTWRFLISEIAAHFGSERQNRNAKIRAAVPGTKERNRLG